MTITGFAQTCFTMDRDAVIKQYAPLVKIIANKLAVRLPSSVDINDLISVGIAGLIEAVDRFDPERGVKIETYLSFRIRGAMLDELRRMDWVPRSIRQKTKQLEEEYVRCERKLGRTPTEEEMAEHFGMNGEELRKFMLKANGFAVLSLEDIGFRGNGEARNVLECIADPNGNDPFQSVNFKEVGRLLGKVIDELPEKERLVLSLYYYEDLNLKEIGEVIGVTESRICQLHSQAILRLKGKLKRFENLKARAL